MKEFLKSEIDERPVMIVLGILVFYILIVGFLGYFYFLHRINLSWTVGLAFVFSLIYLPRFLILKDLLKKDVIQILDDCILINGVGVYFLDILGFRVEECKPQVVFFMNNKMIVYKKAKFYLRLQSEEVSFIAIGGEKISLLKQFFSEGLRGRKA